MDQCEHDLGSHGGDAPAAASAPEESRSWLLVEFSGQWAEKAAKTALPAPLDALVAKADSLGIRVQMIQRATGEPSGHVYICSTTGGWLRRVPATISHDVLEQLARGEEPAVGSREADPMLLVCIHGRRNRCCGRYGGALAQMLSASYPIWKSTHLGGHRFAANLVILPHGLYYGPVDAQAASQAIEAYRDGKVIATRFRGRAGQATAVQEAEHAELARVGALPVADLVSVTR